MKTVYQKMNEFTCGAACFAMLTGCSYQKAVKIVFPKEVGLGVSKKQLLKRLEEFGIIARNSGRLGSKTVDELTADALLHGKILENGEWHEHWMVWDFSEQVVRDPYRYRRPFRLTSYTTLGTES